ncbi:MAG: acyl-ACP--UDP-N-acetylglucosamine O-acyltransferase [Acidobacteriota bacterium]|nr:acyl-ACP--UDP-N-acetylglucosamine O-acyltransferase [Acidobacteriota bacterium]
MAGLIHPTAQVDAAALLDSSVRVGAGAVIRAGVEIGADTEVGAQAQIQGLTRIGPENVIFPMACVGFDPQDLKYEGEESWLEIGARNSIREFSTLNRGTAFGGGTTRIGNDNLFMAYTHVGHDSQVGSRCVFSNAATLAGHVAVGDDVTISAFCSVHQFCRVGRHAYIGGYSVITKDALPFAQTTGQKPQCYGVNSVGLERKGFSKEQIRAISDAFRVLLRSGKNTSQALEALEQEDDMSAEVQDLVDFVSSSERGVIRAQRRGNRGAGEAASD